MHKFVFDIGSGNTYLVHILHKDLLQTMIASVAAKKFCSIGPRTRTASTSTPPTSLARQPATKWI